MASTIRESPVLYESIIDKNLVNLPVDSKQMLTWKCKRCDGTWKEMITKRAKYQLCPWCEPNKTRKSVVSSPAKFVKHKPKTKEIEEVTISARLDMCGICCVDNVPLHACPECSHEVCSECVQRYTFSESTMAKCMNSICGKFMEIGWLVQVCGMEWVKNEYVAHASKVVIEQDKSLIPSAMSFVPMYQLLADFGMNIKDLTYSRVFIRLAGDDEKNAVFDSITRQLGWSSEKIASFKYLQGCPVDNCNGLIDDQGICVVCSGRICIECRNPLIDGVSHICDQEAVESIKAMDGNTKPCIGCASPMYKIDGCDQVWCTVCHTAFNWSTGTVVTGSIHNPHYHQWLKEQGKNIARLDGPERIVNILVRALTDTQIILYTRMMEYVQEPRMVRVRESAFELNHNRVLYVMGLRTKEEWEKYAVCGYSKMRYELTIIRARQNMAEKLRRALAPLDDLSFHTNLEDIRKEYRKVMKLVEVIRCEYNKEMMYANAHFPNGITDYIHINWYNKGY